MSRPFSYNDENFTVIGNILFVHIIDNKARKAFSEPVVEVPPAIFDRLKTYTNFCIASYKSSEDLESQSGTLISTLALNDKIYFVFLSDRPASNYDRLYWSIFFLKDI